MSIIGITGSIGSGKSTLAQFLSFHCNYKIIEIDDLRRYALWQSKSKKHIELREQLSYNFSLPVENTFFNREHFTNIIFSSADKLKQYSSIATPFLKEDVKHLLTHNTFLVWAWLIEENYIEFLNSFTILVNRDLISQTSTIAHRQRLEPSYQSRLNSNIEIIEFHNNDDISFGNTSFLLDKIYAQL